MIFIKNTISEFKKEFWNFLFMVYILKNVPGTLERICYSLKGP